MAREIRLHISGMIYNQTMGGTYSLVMSEDEGLRRRFSVLIGESEAQSIALKLNNAKPPRPLSHDLMNSIIRELNARMVKVLIYDMVNEIFYAEIYLMQGEKPVIIDARTSDAVALAVRSNAPIYINSDILDQVGTVIDIEENGEQRTAEEELPIDLSELTTESVKYIPLNKLQELLEQAVKDERYEVAAFIRDEIEQRNT